MRAIARLVRSHVKIFFPFNILTTITEENVIHVSPVGRKMLMNMKYCVLHKRKEKKNQATRNYVIPTVAYGHRFTRAHRSTGNQRVYFK